MTSVFSVRKSGKGNPKITEVYASKAEADKVVADEVAGGNEAPVITEIPVLTADQKIAINTENRRHAAQCKAFSEGRSVTLVQVASPVATTETVPA